MQRTHNFILEVWEAIYRVMLNAFLVSDCTSRADEYLKNMAIKDDTFKFWMQFVFIDAMAYVGLFLAFRSGCWELRIASMK